MAAVDFEIDELSNAVEVVYKVECTHCGDSADESVGAGSTHGAARRFHESGWRTTSDDTLCPDCSETETE